MKYGTVSFLSDFGLDDGFVGIVHSVIASIAPEVRVIDVTHGIAAHDVRAGGLALARAVQYLNPGVVLAVVDPGVGTDRRAVAVEVGEGAAVLVGPDNGLLAPAAAMVGGAGRAVELTSPDHRLSAVGATFDGRDVFAPAAAHLCRGVPLADLGPEIDPVSLVPGVLPVSRSGPDGVEAEVLWVDRYGNCQLNLGPDDLDGLGPALQLVIDGEVRAAETAGAYDAIASGRLGLVVDSCGLVSVAAPRRSAAVELGIAEGATVQIRTPGDGEPAPGAVTPVALGPNRGDHR